MRYSAILSTILIAALGFVTIPLDEATFRVREPDSRVTFTLSKWTVFKEEGRFTEFEGQITYDEANPEQLEVSFQVEVNSIDTQNSARNRRLMAPDFFNAKEFPRMTFVSKFVEEVDADHLTVTGDLTIKGLTREITIPVKPLGVTHVPDFGTITGFETEFQINRMDFDVTGHRWSDGKNILGHTVDVKLLVSAEMK